MKNKDKIIPSFGQRILERLKDLGMNQEELAAKIETKGGRRGISQTAISQIISRGSTKYPHQFAKHLKTTIEWLENGIGPKENFGFSESGTKATTGMGDTGYRGSRRKVFEMLDDFDTLSAKEQKEFLTMAMMNQKKR